MGKLPRPGREEELVRCLSGLFGRFHEGSAMVREKYARNHTLFMSQTLGRGGKDQLRTGTPVLYATYRSELAEAMELIPEAVFLARKKEDEQRAAHMTALHRAVLERMRFPEEYLRICEYRARYGVGYCEVMMQGNEPMVRAYDPRAIYVDPLCEDMQAGRAVFKLSYHPMSYFESRYKREAVRMKPDAALEGPLAGQEELIPLLTAYLREYDAGRYRVHQIKTAGGVVLYDSRIAHPEGLFAHGQYPFVAWHYDRIPGTPWGFGAFDYLAPVQDYIDRVDTLVMRNLARSARPRLMVSRSAGVDMERLKDEEEEIVEADRIDENALRWQQSAPLAPYAMEILQLKSDMLKRESGQNAATRGEMPASSTSGAAISMLQAAGSKRSNLAQYAINNAFERMVRQVVSDLCQYGNSGDSYRSGDQYVFLTPEDAAGGWEFDLQVRLQRMPQYQSVYQNQLLLQLVQMGALPAKAAFALMDVENKETILAALDKAEQTFEKEGQQHE